MRSKLKTLASSQSYVLAMRWMAVIPFMLLTVGFVLSSSTAFGQAAKPATRQPNIIFILNDDLGWGDVGYHGAEIRTPTLDQLAKRGVELNRYYTFAVCSPTRAALMTGRSSLETGVDAPISSQEVLPMDATLLPQHLKQLGYQTAMIGKWHLGESRAEYSPYKRGFDYYYGFLGGFIDHYTHLTSSGRLDWQRNGVSVRETGYTTDLMTEDAIRQIKSRNKNKPLFLYLAYDAPHAPVQAPEEDVKRYAQITNPVRRTFAAMVDHNDAQIARVLATVESEGMANDTLIIWASDNGPPLQGGATSGGLRGDKGSAFEGGQRVPAIAYWPGHLTGGKKLESVITVLDWFPTLIKAAGGVVPSDKRIVGHDVMATLGGAAQKPGVSMVLGNHVVNGDGYYESAYQWPWKLLRAPTSLIGAPLSPALGADGKTIMLFDVVADQNETTDMAVKKPDLVRNLLSDLDAAPRAPRSLAEVGMAAGGMAAEPAAGMAAAAPAGMLASDVLAGAGALQGYTVEKGEPLAESAARASAAK